MTKKTTDYIDIKDKLEGTLPQVIKRLQALDKKYPKATLRIETYMEYGDTYASATLSTPREMTAVEVELDDLRGKTDLLRQLRTEAAAFARNKASYPRADEMKALAKELGYFALHGGSLGIFRGEILVHDMRGARRRDGTWVLRTMGFGEDDDFTKKMDAMERDQLA